VYFIHLWTQAPVSSDINSRIKTRSSVEKSTCSLRLQRRAPALEHRSGYRGGSPASSNFDDDENMKDDILGAWASQARLLGSRASPGLTHQCLTQSNQVYLHLYVMLSHISPRSTVFFSVFVISWLFNQWSMFYSTSQISDSKHHSIICCARHDINLLKEIHICCMTVPEWDKFTVRQVAS